MLEKKLAIIYSSRKESFVFLMTMLPEQLDDYAGQYIYVDDDSSSKKELFYIGLRGKPFVVTLTLSINKAW